MVEGVLYLDLGVVLAAFDVPLWARISVVSVAVAIALVSNARLRLERRQTAELAAPRASDQRVRR